MLELHQDLLLVFDLLKESRFVLPEFIGWNFDGFHGKKFVGLFVLYKVDLIIRTYFAKASCSKKLAELKV